MSPGHPALPPRVSRPWIVLAVVAWTVASLLAPGPAPVTREHGGFDGPVTLTTDVMAGRFGPWALGTVEGESVLVDFSDRLEAGRGDTLHATGQIGGEPGTASGRPYGAVVKVHEVSSVETSRFILHRAGRFVRESVNGRLAPFDDGRALLSGFLIGETDRISEADVEAMRRSGLAHFVAVSGSNVALFLALLAIAAGPLALGPKRRALLGLLSLPVYVAATRFEPSVMRASFMAGLALAGRLVGVVLEAWQLLSLAVITLVITDPGLTSNVGFQLSVAATAGVLVGARWPVPGRVGRALAVTLGAQLSVAPLLLIHFEAVPLLSPVINLVAAPIVAASTILGAVGVAVAPFLISPAAWLAGIVLALARGTAPWPQLEVWELAGVLILATVTWLVPRLRVVSVAAASLVLAVAMVVPTSSIPAGSVAVLDVGQGDAILIHGGNGQFALVDGGPDPLVLVDKLRDYQVRELELVVLSHVHADHATGLSAAVEAVAIGQVWADPEPHSTSAASALFDAIDRRGIPRSAPQPGERWRLGVLELVVEGPVRRYASPNDQSIVISVLGPAKSMLLAGDIETHAQANLGHLRADVLKVPHQGAATSDAGWLSSVGSEIAVISVGPNQFGHPAEWVVDLLDQTNEVLRTDEMGDVVVDLS
jgi:competence protein ComEC